METFSALLRRGSKSLSSSIYVAECGISNHKTRFNSASLVRLSCLLNVFRGVFYRDLQRL
jgi:hypothetical protein